MSSIDLVVSLGRACLGGCSNARRAFVRVDRRRGARPCVAIDV